MAAAYHARACSIHFQHGSGYRCFAEMIVRYKNLNKRTSVTHSDDVSLTSGIAPITANDIIKNAKFSVTTAILVLPGD